MTFSFLKDLILKYDIFLLDIFGLIHDGVRLYPGAVDMMKALKQENKRVIFVSNAPRTAKRTEENLARLGITKDFYDKVVTPGQLFLDECCHGKGDVSGKYFAFGKPDDVGLVDGVSGISKTDNIEDADFLISFDASQSADDPTLRNTLLEAKSKGLKMICVNPDKIIRRDGVDILCAGYIGHLYQDLGGNVVWYGKPHSLIYERIFEYLGNPNKTKIIAIGDSVETDILGANKAGIASAMVLTGVHSDLLYGGEFQQINFNKILSEYGARPTHLLKDLLS